MSENSTVTVSGSEQSTKKCPFKRGEIFECVPEKISLDGKAVYKKDDFVIFIKNAIPKQTIKAQIIKIKPNYAEATVKEVLHKSEFEIKAKCKHADSCGGCTWQTLPYEKQLEMKEQAVRELFEKQGGLDDCIFMPIVPSPEIWHYRNKMEYSFGFESMEVERNEDKKIFHDRNPSLGMHRKGRWDTIVPLSECHLVSSALFDIVTVFKKIVQDSNMPVYNPKSHKGFWRQLILREGKRSGEIMVNLVISDKDYLMRGKGQILLNTIIVSLQKKSKISSIILTENKGLSDFTGNLKGEAIWGAPYIHDKIGDFTFRISPMAFFQTNTAGAEKLYQLIADYAELSGRETVLDLYCGTGTIGLFLAPRAKWVYGIESNKEAIVDAMENAKLNHFPNTTFLSGLVEKTLEHSLRRIDSLDVVIIDPPRAGMHKKALEVLSKTTPKKLIYISCNPVSLLRDIKKLSEGGFKCEKIQTIDLFPHTTHIESIALLTKA